MNKTAQNVLNDPYFGWWECETCRDGEIHQLKSFQWIGDDELELSLDCGHKRIIKREISRDL